LKSSAWKVAISPANQGEIVKFPRTAAFAASIALTFLPLTAIANAESFSSIVVYGDSLSDNGNLYSAIGYPPAPYYNGHFSNGPVAVEQLAGMLGSPLVDFAWGGATTGVGNYLDGGTQTSAGSLGAPGMLAELAGYSLASVNVPNSLFIVWGGANDFLTGGTTAQAVGDIDLIVSTLQAEGATHILVPNMPDLGLTPDYLGSVAATAYAAQFNAELLASLPAGATYVDTFGLMHQIESNPSAYGITDVTDPCFNKAMGTVCSNPSQYLFWDGFHPTTTTDTILANDFLAASTPEPSSILMLGTGFAGLLGMLRRRRAA
jgi:phospholipase/lecithinase/hemolysin